MFYTQWNVDVKGSKREHSTKDTLVSLVPCMSNQERIAQALLAGSLVQAANVGYDLQADDEITDIVFDVQKRNIDIVDRLHSVQIVRQKIEDHIKGKLNEKTNSVEKEIHQESTKTVSDTSISEREV